MLTKERSERNEIESADDRRLPRRLSWRIQAAAYI
jgi:hypothetical protein